MRGPESRNYMRIDPMRYSKAYYAGYEANVEGFDREDNPYPYNSYDWDQWNDGWYDADDAK